MKTWNVLKKTLPDAVLPGMTCPLVVLCSVNLRQDPCALCPGSSFWKMRQCCDVSWLLLERPELQSQQTATSMMAREAGAPVPRCTAVFISSSADMCSNMQ